MSPLPRRGTPEGLRSSRVYAVRRDPPIAVASWGEKVCELFVGMERHAIALAIALEALQIGTGIRVVMKDRSAAIPVGEEMLAPAGAISTRPQSSCE